MCSCACRHLQSLWPDPATVTWAVLNTRNLIRTNLASDSYNFRPEAPGTGPRCGGRKLWPCAMAGAAPRGEGPGLSPAARRAFFWRSLWKHGIQLWTVTIKNNLTDTLGLFSEAVSLWPVLLPAGQCILLRANFQDTVTSFCGKVLQVWNVTKGEEKAQHIQSSPRKHNLPCIMEQYTVCIWLSRQGIR